MSTLRTVTALAIFIGLTLYVRHIVPSGVFWDAHVYAQAIHAFKNGTDPYLADASARTLYVYPPIFLALGSALSFHAGWFLYIGLTCLATVSIPFILSVGYIRSTWMRNSVTLCIFSLLPGFMSEVTFLTGNIAPLLYALILGTGVSGIRRGRWWPFVLVVSAAGMLKPPFLAFLLMPLIESQYLAAAAALVLAGCAYLIQLLAAPRLYAEFKSNVYSQIVLLSDSGAGFVGILHPRVGLIVHCAVSVPVVFYLWLNRSSGRHSPIWLPTLVLLCVLLSPRLMSYDLCVGMLVAIYIAVKLIGTWERKSLPWAAIAGVFVLLAYSRHPDAGNFVFLLLTLLTALTDIGLRSKQMQQKTLVGAAS